MLAFASPFIILIESELSGNLLVWMGFENIFFHDQCVRASAFMKFENLLAERWNIDSTITEIVQHWKLFWISRNRLRWNKMI